MMHKAWSSTEEVPYCFSRSYVKLQSHTALKIVEFHPNWAFPDCNSSLNSPMAMKCCTKLGTALERCPIVFQGHPSNFKVTRYKTSSILTQIGRFRTIGRSQLSNPSDLPCSITKDLQTISSLIWVQASVVGWCMPSQMCVFLAAFHMPCSILSVFPGWLAHINHSTWAFIILPNQVSCVPQSPPFQGSNQKWLPYPDLSYGHNSLEYIDMPCNHTLYLY